MSEKYQLDKKEVIDLVCALRRASESGDAAEASMDEFGKAADLIE